MAPIEPERPVIALDDLLTKIFGPRYGYQEVSRDNLRSKDSLPEEHGLKS